jgi:hypothetical protein
MDSILLSGNGRVLDGLRKMLTTVIGDNEYVFAYVDLPVALLLIELCKRSEDRAEWFPLGKWATIQLIQERVAQQLDGLFPPKRSESGTSPL